MKDYITVRQFKGDVCEMCIAYNKGEQHIDCNDLPDCAGFVFIRPEDLPEYHVRFLADRLENP